MREGGVLDLDPDRQGTGAECGTVALLAAASVELSLLSHSMIAELRELYNRQAVPQSTVDTMIPTCTLHVHVYTMCDHSRIPYYCTKSLHVVSWFFAN